MGVIDRFNSPVHRFLQGYLMRYEPPEPETHMDPSASSFIFSGSPRGYRLQCAKYGNIMIFWEANAPRN